MKTLDKMYRDLQSTLQGETRLALFDGDTETTYIGYARHVLPPGSWTFGDDGRSAFAELSVDVEFPAPKRGKARIDRLDVISDAGTDYTYRFGAVEVSAPTQDTPGRMTGLRLKPGSIRFTETS